LKVELWFPHKIRNPAIRELTEQYLSYTRRYVSASVVTMALVDRQGRTGRRVKERLGRVHSVCCSPRGQMVESTWFKARLELLAGQGRDLVFVVGEAHGLPADLEGLCTDSIALSRLTFPHELALVLLAEQVWRGTAMWHGHPYHK